MYQEIELGKLVAQEQVRTDFDKKELESLANDIKDHGVLQPIGVRASEGGIYRIIYGERRYRASIMAGKATIPVRIFDENFTDEEIDRIQLTENIQRVNLNPIELAEGMRNLIEKFGEKETAHLLSRSIYDVRRSMVLLNLIPAFRKLLLSNKINQNAAFALARLPQDAQKYLWTEHKDEDLDSDDWMGWAGNYTTTLDKTLFPLELVAGLGSCVGCQFNSASAILFPEEKKQPAVCSNPDCFHTKRLTSLTEKIKEFSEDPTKIIIIASGTVHPQIKDLLEGIECYKLYEQLEAITKPVKPSAKEFETEHEFERATLKYEAQLETFNKKVDKGIYLEGLIVTGSYAGQVNYYQIRKSKAIEAKTNAPEAPQIDFEVQRLETRANRGKELDIEKIARNIHDNIIPSIDYASQVDPFTAEENKAILLAMYTSLQGKFQHDFLQIFGYKTLDELWCENKLDLEKMRKAQRLFVLGHINKVFIHSACLAAIQAIATKYDPQGVQDILNAQAEVAAKRESRIQQKIATLKQE